MAKRLTVNELMNLGYPSVVWEEFFNGKRAERPKPMLMSRYGVLYDEDGEIPIDRQIYDPFNGNQRRRFWDAKPTKAERDAVKW